MNRLFYVLAAVLLLSLPFAVQQEAQPVFFSMLFPQLVPEYEQMDDFVLEWRGRLFGEAVEL